jgi:hypothetical protein
VKVIEPVLITDANFISSTVAEPASGETEFNAGTTYALGARVTRSGLHRLYESLQAGNAGHTPETSPDWWVEVSANNRWSMFDQVIGTATTAVTSFQRVRAAPRR